MPIKVIGVTPDFFLKNVGKEVVLTLKNTSAARHGPFAHLEQDTFELRGKIMQRPRGHEREFDMFGFAVPFTEVPLRVVHLSQVVTVDGVKLTGFTKAKAKPRQWSVRSSRGEERYTVSERNGTWTCSCVANANFRKVCKHITQMKEQHG